MCISESSLKVKPLPTSYFITLRQIRDFFFHEDNSTKNLSEKYLDFECLIFLENPFFLSRIFTFDEFCENFLD